MTVIAYAAHACFAIFSFIALALSAGQAAAFSVNPLSLDMEAAGRDARAAINVVNDGQTPLPVEIRVFRLGIEAAGKENKQAADQDFIVFPPQAIVKPGATQIFRIQWAGEPGLKRSQSYLLSVNQLPVRFAEAQSGVQIVFSFSVITSVAPVQSEAKLNAVNIAAAGDGDKSRTAKLVVENTGTRHGYVADAALILKGSGWNRTVSPGEMKQWLGLGLVQPGQTRQFLLPIDVPKSAGRLSAELRPAQDLRR